MHKGFRGKRRNAGGEQTPSGQRSTIRTPLCYAAPTSTLTSSSKTLEISRASPEVVSIWPVRGHPGGGPPPGGLSNVPDATTASREKTSLAAPRRKPLRRLTRKPLRRLGKQTNRNGVADDDPMDTGLARSSELPRDWCERLFNGARGFTNSAGSPENRIKDNTCIRQEGPGPIAG